MSCLLPVGRRCNGWLLWCLLMLCSCNTNILFKPSQPLLHGQKLNLSKADSLPEHVLSTDDMLTISVLGHEDLSVGSIYAPIGGSIKESGKWVIIDIDGEVILPLLGRIQVAGLTVKEAELYLQTLYEKYIEAPRITVRVVNRTISVLGEVGRPGNYTIEKQRVTLVEALSVAGGFTENARASRVQLIRNTQDSVQTYIVDLTKINTLTDPKLLLQSGDVVYIPPRRTRQLNKTGSSVLPFISIVTGIIFIITTFANR